MTAGGDSGSRTAWAIPRSVLVVALRVSVILTAPLAVAIVWLGPNAALGLIMGYLGSVAPALLLARKHALALAVLPAMAAAVAVAVNGEAFAAACFVALSCLLVAPANQTKNGLLAGIPTLAAVLATAPAPDAPVEMAAWTLAGGVLVVLTLAPLRKDTEAVGVEPWTAWAHAIVMGAAVGTSVLLVTEYDVDHGYWICLTLTVVLRPFGRETLGVARERVLGTVGGAVLSFVLILFVSGPWLLLSVGALVVLMVAYNAMGRTGQQVVFLTPIVIIVASGAVDSETLQLAVGRVIATLVGAVVAGLLALILARADRARRSPNPSR